jgi:N-acetylglucosaminyldiphosphoundecaprenol N-acetyl-beta-D-mannosaminyltransferase
MISMPIQVDDSVVEMVNESGAGIVFLSLGCPKQEKWMMAYKDRINAVMLGIGGVFPLYAGIHSRAPQFVRSAGLEWLYRLVQEPKRLWGRYSETIPPFLWMAIYWSAGVGSDVYPGDVPALVRGSAHPSGGQPLGLDVSS